MTVTDRTPDTRTSAVEAHRVAGLIGAEITGVDLSRELTDAEVADIRSALLTHKVVFFRDQDVTPEQQVAWAALR